MTELKNKAVLISIRPKWCRLIFALKKLIEARKTYPKLKPPFKCYVYCTIGSGPLAYNEYCGYDMETFENDFLANGTVIGEFTCNGIFAVLAHPSIFAGYPMFFAKAIQDACLTEDEVETYSKGKDVYGWGISNVKIYDKPRNLADFGLTRAPQSWCYVEEVA